MKTYLTFNTKYLINKLNSGNGYYEMRKNMESLYVRKIHNGNKGRPSIITLPKTILISPQTVGLIAGEGFLGNRTFVFANSNYKAIENILIFLKQFNLPLKFYLEISVKNKSKNFIKECESFWEKRLKIKIRKIRLRKEFNTIIKHGTIHITVCNSIFASLLMNIITTSKKDIEKSKTLSLDYMKGIIAAEGNVNVKKSTKCVYMIRISATKQKERDHYKKCLKKIGINIYCKDMPTVSKEEGLRRGWKTDKGRAGAVIINRWENFYKIHSMNLLEIHEDKKQKFLHYFPNNKTTKWILEFQSLPNKWLRIKDLIKIFKLANTPSDRIRKMLLLEFLEKKKINKSKLRPMYAYKLTSRYYKFIDSLSDNTPLINSQS